MSLIKNVIIQSNLEDLDRNGYSINFFGCFSENPPLCNFMNTEFQILCKFKSKIDTYKHIWEIAKRFINPYELIFTNSKLHIIENISRKTPISRSYFKMIEIISLLIPPLSKTPKIFAHLAEGPGGFVEATNDIRNYSYNIKSNSRRDDLRDSL